MSDVSPDGGHLRIVQSRGRQPGYEPATDPNAVPRHEPRRRPGGTWDRGGNNAYSSPIHKTETVDYGILFEGERVLLLDDAELVMKPGDVVVQVGNWHGWTSPREDCRMAFIMMGGTFEDGSAVATPHPHGPIRASGEAKLPAGVKSVRRIVTIDGEVTLLLDTQAVQLQAGDTVIQRGTNHAWSNRSTRPCAVAISSHDGI